MNPLLDVPGVASLRGKGVYLEMPDELPASLRNQHVVVVASSATATAAASRLHACGCRVTVLPAESFSPHYFIAAVVCPPFAPGRRSPR